MASINRACQDRSVNHDQWGTGKEGPILAAKIRLGSQIRSVHHDQWGGTVFGLGGTNFGCQNQSGETDFGCQNWSGGPFFSQKSVRGGPLWGGDRFWCDRPDHGNSERRQIMCEHIKESETPIFLIFHS